MSLWAILHVDQTASRRQMLLAFTIINVLVPYWDFDSFA